MASVTTGPCVSSPCRLGALFSACDLDGSGYIDEAELAFFCTDFSAGEVADVFRELDKDCDGRISIGEFSRGFREFTSDLAQRNQARFEGSIAHAGSSADDHQVALPNTSDSSDSCHSDDERCLEFLGEDGGLSATSQEHVCKLYQSIHNSELPHLTALFENVVLAVVRDIKQHQYENERLERSYKRDKEQHARHLRQLEEEMEGQMARVEARVKEEDREHYETEKEELRTDLENEISELTKNIKKLQKLEEEATITVPSDDLKHRVDELLSENRQLRAAVTDASTNLVLSRSECATSRQQLEEKCYELESEKSSLLEYIHEQESLTRQVHLLHDANKKLHDTNDDLRSALENSRLAQKRSFGSARGPVNRFRNADFVSDYIDSSRNMQMRSSMTRGATLADELNMSLDIRGRNILPSQETCEMDSLPDDIDSGHSTLRDLPDLDSEYEPNSIEEDAIFPTPRKRNQKLIRSEFGSTTESEIQSESQDEMETEVDQEDECDECDGPCSGSGSGCLSPVDPLGDPRVQGRPVSRQSMRSCASTCSCGSRGSKRHQVTLRKRPAVINILKPITKPPERMYKVVLAGDAAVGKSSFIMRLCKGRFVNNISSTLGVDFQTKIVEVDGRVVALQLWDTAGQERFRSIAKSYFRRADGVLLLYDCTYERSFLNIRDWLDAIEDGAQKKIPIMFCGNKTDLREDLEAEAEHSGKTVRRMVKREDGQRLAKEYDGLFTETSAKENNNVLEAVTELARMLRTNEDLEVKSVGMQLQDLKVQEKKGFMCCKA